MGIRENFSQAVKELTGNSKDDANKTTADKKSAQVNELRRAINEESPDIREDFIPFDSDISDLKSESHIPEELNVGIHELQEKAAAQIQSQQPVYPYSAKQNNQDIQNTQNIANTQNAQNNRIVQPGAFASQPPQSGFGSQYGGNVASEHQNYSNIYNYNGTNLNYQPVQNNNNNNDDEITVISKNTVIDGNIRSFANMNIDGDIKGDVETTKNVDLNGKIVGNITCNNAEMHSSQIQGNIRMKGNVIMERDTLLIGDLISTYAKVNGKVKGNLDVAGKAELKGDAVVFGDISASTITVDDGAIIQGYVSTTFLNKEESRNIFPDTISISE